YTSIFTVIQRLREVCDHPALITGKREPVLGRSEKFDLAVEKISSIVEGGEQVVLFSNSLVMLDLFEAVLGDSGISYMRLDGSTTDRQGVIDAFNRGEADVALCSIRAAGQGIELTAANHVIHVDRWWNPALEDQATDRVHRIGQNKTVYVYRIQVTDTLEERIDALLESKRQVSAGILTPATAGARSWTREELLEILSPIE
ncbi:MAG: C-terminal helicase domain-containing protein, partial [Candidatus Bipolaricaulota bacterium]|nr:C-terminal helicase domain-containing protein [Candidatus Bipolaricaulota bacterium]